MIEELLTECFSDEVTTESVELDSVSEEKFNELLDEESHQDKGKSIQDNKLEKFKSDSSENPDNFLDRNTNSFDNIHDQMIEKFNKMMGIYFDETNSYAGSEKETSDSEKENDGDKTEKKLTNEEINEKQREEIKNALQRIANGEQLTKEELGNLGEMMMDQYYILQGYTPLNEHRVTSLDDKKTGNKTGIDGVYEKTNTDGTKSYVIADAKFNSSPLGDTQDGKQMSDNWIDKRLDNAVGKEKADEIRDAQINNPNSVSHEIYHINPNTDANGNIHTDVRTVDGDGNKTGEKNIVEYYDSNGNRLNDTNINSIKED